MISSKACHLQGWRVCYDFILKSCTGTLDDVICCRSLHSPLPLHHSRLNLRLLFSKKKYMSLLVCPYVSLIRPNLSGTRVKKSFIFSQIATLFHFLSTLFRTTIIVYSSRDHITLLKVKPP